MTTTQTTNQNGIVTMQEIQSQARGHFFGRASMRFFASRLSQTGYRLGNRAYFITSEQFHGSGGYSEPRRYTLRYLDYETGDIHTVEPFNKLTRSAAQTALKNILRKR